MTDLIHQVTGIGVCIGLLVPIAFWIAVSLHRIANAAYARRDPRTGVLSRD